MASIRGYIAVSLDGYIATADGGVEWLSEFDGDESGYEKFAAEIGTVVMGRKTYDQALGFGGPWPYADQSTLVLTHRPPDDAPEGVGFHEGDVAALARSLRKRTDGDVWIVGGAEVQQAFLDAGELDRIEVFVIPRLLGRGISLWPPTDRGHRLTLRSADALPAGMVRLDYDVGRP